MTLVYATVLELRAATGITTGMLDDTAADLLMAQAEDVVDALLGARSVDDITGRKVVEADVSAWQWSRLKRATILVAAKLRAEPAVLSAVIYSSTSGPDFSYSGRAGGDSLRSRLGSDIVLTLDGARLGRFGTHATVGRTKPVDLAGWEYDPDLDGDD